MQSSVTRTQPSSSSLRDTVEVILDKGMVIDAYVRISLVGIELITIDARIVIASVETYLKYAEKVDRINLREKSEAMNLGSLFGSGGLMNTNNPDNEDEENEDNSNGLTRRLINSVVDKAISKIK